MKQEKTAGSDVGSGVGHDGRADESEFAFGPVEAVAAPEPFTTIGMGLSDLVESVASEIGELLSPEEARRRELTSVMKNRSQGRER